MVRRLYELGQAQRALAAEAASLRAEQARLVLGGGTLARLREQFTES